MESESTRFVRRPSRPPWRTACLERPRSRKKVLGFYPIGRFGESIEVAEAVVWMCSSAAGFMTGQSLVLDGGFLAGPNVPSE